MSRTPAFDYLSSSPLLPSTALQVNLNHCKMAQQTPEKREYHALINQSRLKERHLPTRRLVIALAIACSFLYGTYMKAPLLFFNRNSSPTTHQCHATASSPFGPASPDLNWVSCGDRFQCANLSVPLDYLNKGNGKTASIAITRYLAANRTSETGTLIFNPGGPGGSGSGSTYRLGPGLDKILQGKYDILGFDPRGINLTLPTVTCLQSLVTRFSIQQILGSTAPSLNLHDVGVKLHSAGGGQFPSIFNFANLAKRW